MTAVRMQAGFTLAELLGALAIAAILTVPLADMLRGGADSARTVRTALDLQADARFALGRIAARAASAADVTADPVGATITAASVFERLTYTLSGTDLVERETGANPHTSVIAANVTAFQLSVPEVVAGYRLLTIDLTLSADGNTVTRTRTVRVGGPP